MIMLKNILKERRNNMNLKYKDKCDKCHQMKICKGYNNKCLCEDCIKKEKSENIEIIIDNKDGQAKFSI